MNAIVQLLNTAGRAFVDFAVPMLLQSSLLVLILLAVDAVLRKRVRAVLRYWIWMLVLVKLVLPPSLWSPVSVGTWLGDRLEVPTATLLEHVSRSSSPRSEGGTPSTQQGQDALATGLSPAVTSLFSRAQPAFVEPLAPPSPLPAQPAGEENPISRRPVSSLNWQALVLLTWSAVVTALLLLLAQRTFFVQGLVAQADEAGGALRRELDQCCRHLGLRRRVALRLSPSAASPAICGLLYPTILIPQNLASRLHGTDLQAVLFHELAHLTRGDLWINLFQTLLQIVYFYSPLLGLANALIRRIREKAVDETVLVAMGADAPQYPETLVTIAKLAFTRRPALSLRLIGVVESRSALTSRIQHILNRPLPKTARLGLLGLLAIFLIAAVLLPMAKGNVPAGWFGKDVFFRFYSNPTDATQRRVGDTEFYTEYTVSFRKGEKLAVVAELYQDGQPMRTLGAKVFSDPGRPQRLSALLTRDYRNRDRTAIGFGLEVALGDDVLRVKDIAVNTPTWYNATESTFFCESQIARTREGRSSYVRFANLLWIKAGPVENRSTEPRVWIPAGDDIATMYGDAYLVLLKMFPVSQLSEVRILGPGGRAQLPDGRYLEADAPGAKRQAVADEYVLNLTRLLLRDRMPLAKLIAHQYWRVGESVWISVPVYNGAGWKPSLEQLSQDGKVNPCLFLIDGKEYASRLGFGPFDGGGLRLVLPGELYESPADFHLPVGKHTVAYGWKDLDVIDPNDPDHPVHFPRLMTDPVAFEVVEQLPAGYYRQVYEEGWEDILRRSVETAFTDDVLKYGVFGSLLLLRVDRLPFDTAFAVYVQAEGSDQQQRVGELAQVAGSFPHTLACDHGVKELTWNTVGDRRWRIILRPSVEVAKRSPPIREFYAREFVTDWLSFKRSPQFEQHRQAWEQDQVRVQSADAGGKAVPSAGTNQEKEIVLPEVDRRPVVLDLATGALVPLPSAGPEPEKLEQALQKLGQGDLLYDCDSGDRTLILVRNATSEQAQEDTGEPPWKGYLIGPHLPGVLTVKTAEGRQYKVTIPAASDEACTLKYSLIPTDKGAGGGALAEPGRDAAEPRAPQPTGSAAPPQELSGRVVDPNGNPVAGAQVALCTKDKGVNIQAGQLLPTKWGGKGGEIVKTDAQGRFSFASAPDEFHLIAAYDQGFAWVTNKERAAPGALRLEPWSRLEGTLKIGREVGAGERVSLLRGGNRSAADQNIHLDYETYADSSGQFTFKKVPPTWMEVGYMIRTGESTSSYTGRTPIHLLPGQSLTMTLGGEGRPVIGKFIPPAGYERPVYFGQGLRALDTVRPDLPKPANYDQMTKREQQEWLTQWYETVETEAYYDALWHDLKRRHYTFRIEDDGTFRIEDVIPGRYKFTVWLEERPTGQGRPEEIGAYYGTIEAPAIPGSRTDEPLDLGNLTLAMHNPPLHAGDMAPLFEAKTLDGKDIRLADYRGKFVLLSFWQPVSHPELDRLRELHKAYGGAGKLAIIDFGGWDTLKEVRKYVAEHQIEWPEIYFGPSNKEGIANQYGLPGVPYILLVDPQGKIVATWLRTEKLMQAVRDALGEAK